MRLIVAGGGTGGHLFPGIAVAEEFLSRAPGNEVLFVGTEQGIEHRVLPGLGYELKCISAAGIRGKSSLSRIKGLAMMLYGYAQSRKILREFRPHLVLGVGGYASFPMVMAAGGMEVPRFIHEQNAIPGMTNKVLSRFADRTFITLEESGRFFPGERVLLTGNPLRRQILASIEMYAPGESRQEGLSDFRHRSFNLLVFGGSQGAHAINMAMKDALPDLALFAEQLEIRHQSGEKDCDALRTAYSSSGIKAVVFPFINDMAEAYRWADLVVCRAGATTIAEVTACAKPCIFIPFPHAVDDHQRRNAEALLKQNACFMMIEQELKGTGLAALIKKLMHEPELLEQTGRQAFQLARLDAAAIIVDEMLKTRTGV